MKLLTEWLTSSQDFFRDLGPLGIVAYAAVMVIAGATLVPLSPFAIAAGLIFGFGKGLLAVQLGTITSAAVNFLISRHVARGLIQRKLETFPKFQAIDAAVGKEGGKVVALLRFVPVPFAIVNYAFGLTSVRFWPYVVATFFPIILNNAFFVWLGSTAQAGLEVVTGAGRPRHPLEYAMMGLGGLAALTAMVVVTRIARQAIAQRDQSLVAE